MRMDYERVDSGKSGKRSLLSLLLLPLVAFVAGLAAMGWLLVNWDDAASFLGIRPAAPRASRHAVRSLSVRTRPLSPPPGGWDLHELATDMIASSRLSIATGSSEEATTSSTQCRARSSSAIHRTVCASISLAMGPSRSLPEKGAASLADVLGNSGKLEQALPAIRQSIELDPDEADAVKDATTRAVDALFLFVRGDLKRAMNLFNRDPEPEPESKPPTT